MQIYIDIDIDEYLHTDSYAHRYMDDHRCFHSGFVSSAVFFVRSRGRSADVQDLGTEGC